MCIRDSAYCFHSVTGYSKIDTYIGNNGSAQTIFTGFEPSWVMIKNTASGYSWSIIDNKRSTSKRLYANGNDAQNTPSPTMITSFNSDGFTLGTNADVNNSTNTYLYMAFA